ncbi:MAG: nucleotide exchange factor GrpE [Lachnospiraceae bacterium]|nr:nucleotide exchange factor GrpE [Lachnospiraceae bacterium]
MAKENQDEEKKLNEPEAGQPEEKAGSEQAAEPSEADADQAQADGADAEPAEAEPDKSETAGKSDKKKKKGDRKAEALQTRIEELEDRVKRQMAEFDNFRKRTDKEKNAMFETGARSVIEKILPVVDNFERGLASVPEDEGAKAFVDGMNMIYKQLIDELDKMEVKPIEAVGCEFDPELHNAVMQVESDEYESGIVAQELQKGYTYRGTVVRHSMVAVVQ